MENFISNFHLLRPFWLLALVPSLLLFVFLLKQKLASARWTGVIDQDLMPHVLDQTPTEQERWPLWFLLLAWILSCIALSGPSWEKLPQPVQKKEDALVIMLDMSLSMAATDVSPDRATRSQQKTIDILKQRKEGLTALITYAGDAHTVTPLTDDSETITNLVPALSPFIMPARGSRPDKAIELANTLIKDAGLTKARYLLITDGILDKDIKRIKNALKSQNSELSILTIGTEEGAPISIPDQGFLKDATGSIVLPRLDLEPFKQLSNQTGIRWYPMSYTDDDWRYLLEASLESNLKSNVFGEDSNQVDFSNSEDANSKNQQQFDLWSDQGFWLIAFALFVCLFSFRRGWLLCLPIALSLHSQDTLAFEWQDLWKSKDQQGSELFEQSPKLAADTFEHDGWKGSSYYKAEDYENAAAHFSDDPDLPTERRADNHYNRGNALAKANKLEEAIAAYDQALELAPDMPDALFNKQLLEQLKQEQQDQNGQDGDDQKDGQDQQDSQNQQGGSDQNEQDQSDEQNGDNKESQSQENQNQESSGQEQQESESSDSQNGSQQEQNQENAEDKKQSSESTAGKDEEKEELEQQQSQAADKESSDEEQQASQEQVVEGNGLSREEQQRLKQWLNRVPDDPGGLLKRKFLYQYQQRGEQEEGDVQW